MFNTPWLLDVKPTRRYLDHGVVHQVVWFGYIHATKSREMWTACGEYFMTKNRTPFYKNVTCVGCMCR